jgi:hypothetical protein
LSLSTSFTYSSWVNMASGSSTRLTAWSPKTLEGPRNGLVDGQEEPAAQLTATLDARRPRLSLIADREFR